MQYKPIVFISEHFYPRSSATGQLIHDLAEGFSTRGIPIIILTSSAGPNNQNYPIIRLSSTHIDSVNIYHKLKVGINFFFKSLFWLLKNSDKYGNIFIVSNPPFIGLLGVLLSLLKEKRYTFLFQDIFPRSAILAGILPSHGPVTLIWKLVLQIVIKKSTSTVLLSQAMKKRCVTEFYNPINLEVIPNWSVVEDLKLSEQSKPRNDSQYLSIQYSGNFGRLHDIITILEASRLLKSRRITFQFIGNGMKREQIIRYKSVFKLQNVMLYPYEPLSRLQSSIMSSDISIVSLLSGAEDTVAPSKLYGILACRRPIILIARRDSELSRLVIRENIGITVEPGEPDRLAEAIYKLSQDRERLLTMSANAFKLYFNCYSKSAAINRYVDLLSEST